MQLDSAQEPQVEFADYRPLSGLALGALGLGLASVLAVAFPLLWVVPALGIALAAWSLRQVAGANPTRSGRGIALAALAFSLIFGVAGPVRAITRNHVLTLRGQTFANFWIDAVRRGDLYTAYELSLPPQKRALAPGSTKDPFAGRPTEKQRFENFSTRESLQTLVKILPGAATRFVSGSLVSSSARLDEVQLVYEVQGNLDGTLRQFQLAIYLNRSIDAETGREAWTVNEFGTN